MICGLYLYDRLTLPLPFSDVYFHMRRDPGADRFLIE